MSLWGEAPWLWCTETLTVGTVMLSHSSCYISFPASPVSPLSPAFLITGKWLCVPKPHVYIQHGSPLAVPQFTAPIFPLVPFGPLRVWAVQFNRENAALGYGFATPTGCRTICTCNTKWWFAERNLTRQRSCNTHSPGCDRKCAHW